VGSVFHGYKRHAKNLTQKEIDMSLQQIVIWIIVGGIAGWLADMAVKGVRLGLLGAILVGIIGGFLGGWLFGLLNISIGAGSG
jgi:uncharacterized membrane protein YeaQ/YmgE (transglycosylase-associated protein family)